METASQSARAARRANEAAEETADEAAGDTADEAPAAKSRRARNAADKRRAVLDGARAVFMAEGFGGASMDAIAAAAGVSKMAGYL